MRQSIKPLSIRGIYSMNSQGENRFSLLLVDDELPILELLRDTFTEDDYTIHTSSNGREAIEILQSTRVDAALIDLIMPEMDGLELLKTIRDRFPATMVIMLTGHGGIREAVEATRLGAVDFLEKPFNVTALRVRISQLHRIWQLKEENRQLRAHVGYKFGYQDLIGNSTSMLKLKELIARVGPTDTTVLIQGETGTGKELVARAIHHHSPRSENSFVPVDCAAISETVMESELFGHVKGAFTGAYLDTPGLIRSADRGTLFLDEVGDLTPTLQVKLLRTLQEREVRPVGSSRRFAVDVRILAATNRDLEQEVEHGKFREDLYYRLNVVKMRVGLLRERKDDVVLLARYFIKRFANDASPVTNISQEIICHLENYDWPGNVRELENVIRRAVALGRGSHVLLEDLPPRLYSHPDSPCSPLPPIDSPPDDSLTGYEIAAIKNALTKSGNNRTRAAKILKIGEATLYRKIKKYGLIG